MFTTFAGQTDGCLRMYNLRFLFMSQRLYMFISTSIAYMCVFYTSHTFPHISNQGTY